MEQGTGMKWEGKALAEPKRQRMAIGEWQVASSEWQWL
jgi:hypothetical protein